MIKTLRWLLSARVLGRRWVAQAAALAWILLLGPGAVAQEPPVHYWHSAGLPPGAVGARQLQRGGPLPGFFQPVEIRAPEGAMISLVANGQFDQEQVSPKCAGLLIGAVYRLRVTNVPLHPGLEVFPSIELIDRLYTPPGQERRFAIPLELTQEDLELALAGKFVTRVIYLEDPQNATPARSTPEQNWFDIGPGRDPLAVADALGRPVAILRLGGRMPIGESGMASAEFLYNCPPWLNLPAPAAPRAAAPQPAPARAPGPAPAAKPESVPAPAAEKTP